jgi:DNA-binding HxlR family transcriptional regulator
MSGYGQFCPVSRALDLLGERWTLLVVRALLQGATRFSEVQRALSRISPTVLSRRLRDLEEHGIVVRKPGRGGGGHEYRLTPAGRELAPVVMNLAEWGMRWARSRMEDEELDVQLLMTEIQRRIDPAQLPDGRTVVCFQFPELHDFAEWWVVVDDGDADLCTHDPGYEVDVYVTADLRALIEVWMGDIPLSRARKGRDVEVLGQHALVRSIGKWLPLNELAGMRRETSRRSR